MSGLSRLERAIAIISQEKRHIHAAADLSMDLVHGVGSEDAAEIAREQMAHGMAGVIMRQSFGGDFDVLPTREPSSSHLAYHRAYRSKCVLLTEREWRELRHILSTEITLREITTEE